MESSKQKTFIITIVVAVLFVIGLGIFINKPQASGPSKYDDFAKALTSSGAEFYGAFWCPHCQAEKALFGTAKQYLPYKECSNADRSQTQICIDKKIEAYPTWYYPNGIKITSAEDPIVCAQAPGVATDNAICKQIASQYSKVWKFKEYAFYVRSPSDPVKSGTTWTFPATASTMSEVPLEFLAQQIGYTLPQ